MFRVTLERMGGGGGCQPSPQRFFSNVFKTINCLLVLSSLAVPLFLIVKFGDNRLLW